MSDPFYGEIRALPFTYAPLNWAYCWGQQVSLAQYEVLYVVIGTLYGGDGRTYFNLPDMRGRVAVSTGERDGLTWEVGDVDGEDQVALSLSQMPAHTHSVTAGTPKTLASLANAPGPTMLPSMTANQLNYTASGTWPTVMNPAMIGASGAGTPIENRQPALAISFFICLLGAEFPSRG